MKESQNIEWKETWRDEYIKWICGFANAAGGTLVIGKNDKGVVTGVSNAKKLLADIPNKVRDILGIIVDVNLKTDKGKDFLEIVVEPYPYPVSYKGQYHYRSGSTKQELKGSALDAFLLKNMVCIGTVFRCRIYYPNLLKKKRLRFLRKKLSKASDWEMRYCRKTGNRC